MKHLKSFNESNSGGDITKEDYEFVFSVLQSAVFDDLDIYENFDLTFNSLQDEPTWFINNESHRGVPNHQLPCGIITPAYLPKFRNDLEEALNNYKHVIEEETGFGYLIDKKHTTQFRIVLYRV